MIYALVHYPNINIERINQLRRKYDPQFNLIEPHITIVFPVPDTITENLLVAHIEGVLHTQAAFPLQLRGLARSQDDYLFLLVQDGNEKMVRLHEAMYTGLIASYRNSQERFIPHITLGRLNGNVEGCAKARAEAERLSLDYRCVFDRVHLVKINDERTRILWTQEFLL